MNSLPAHTSPPIVRAAVVALDAFGADSVREARTLLGMWARRDQLTALDIADVLRFYEPPGMAYERDDEVPAQHLPEGVEGHRPVGREWGRR